MPIKNNTGLKTKLNAAVWEKAALPKQEVILKIKRTNFW